MAKDDKSKSKPESAETQTASPADEETPEEDLEEVEGFDYEEDDSKVVEKPKPEAEAVWEGLSGKTQDRVMQLLRRAKKAEEELGKSKFQTTAPSAAQEKTDSPSETEVKEAISKLRGYGVVTQEDMRTLQDRIYLDREHSRLENKFNGSDGRPKYVSEEVEDYAKSHYFGGNLEAAYWDMYRDELIDAEVKSRGSKKKIVTEKPTASVKIGEQPLTRESLAKRLAEPDGAEWWQKNREKIEPLLKKLSQA
jgi:hypothetical protein